MLIPLPLYFHESQVSCEEAASVEKYLRSWCRVDVQRSRRSLVDVAYDTGSFDLVHMLDKYRTQNEFVMHALALDYDAIESALCKRVGTLLFFLLADNAIRKTGGGCQ